MNLTEIANKYGTDKGTKYQEAHGYTEIYQKYIKPEGNYTLLEIGIWYGASIRMWKEYNPEMNLHAIDIDPRVASYSNEFNVHIGDQTDRIFLENVAKKTGPLDFIIDDGSHVGDHIVKSFAFLFPHLKSGGYYFIEDLHAGHADRKNTLSRILDIIGNTPCIITITGEKLFIVQKT